MPWLSEDSAVSGTQWFTAEACFDGTPLKMGWLLLALRKKQHLAVFALNPALSLDHLVTRSTPAHCSVCKNFRSKVVH